MLSTSVIILEPPTVSKEVIIVSICVMYLVQFRIRSTDVYKDTLMGQMVAPEQVEVASPESCWVE